MAFQQTDDNRIPLHVKVFTNWVSNKLKGKSQIEITDITKDLNNGVILIELARILTGKNTPRRWVATPKRKIDMVQNCDLAIELFNKDGVKTVGISGKDINDCNQKLILGLIWTLISHYSIMKSVANSNLKNNNFLRSTDKLKRKNSEEKLKNWAIERTSNYPNVTNFEPYNLAMCALLDSFVPDKINFNSLDPKDSTNNSNLAVKVMKELGIPILVDSEIMKNVKLHDEKSILTQLSSVKVKLESLQNLPLKATHNNSVKMSTMSFSMIGSTEDSFDVDSEVDKIIEETNVKVAKVLEKSLLFKTEDSETEKENIEEEEEENDQNLDKQPSTNEKLNNQISSEKNSEEEVFIGSEIEGDNIQFEGKKFGLVMHLNEGFDDEELAVTLVRENHPFLNPAGLKLDLTKSNIENDVNQQFVFGKKEWNTVIDSVAQQGMVWDVADVYNSNPPEGTSFYLFPFHGRHNQHFVYKDQKIYAKQNGMVVTYVGGDDPFQMMLPSQKLKSRQTFQIQILSC